MDRWVKLNVGGKIKDTLVFIYGPNHLIHNGFFRLIISHNSRIGSLSLQLMKQFFKAILIYRISLSTFCINVLVYVWKKKQKTSLCVKKKAKNLKITIAALVAMSQGFPMVTKGY